VSKRRLGPGTGQGLPWASARPSGPPFDQDSPNARHYMADCVRLRITCGQSTRALGTLRLFTTIRWRRVTCRACLEQAP